ncbi:glutaredoxin family protein [Sediminibacillus halophilus]|uniref:Glutaredoxin n=1 Tax=Sediminibacillus halophilus TaxID=482461 RepID=A0A1G9WS63_9BACI|nr:glutaredoxin family protein [Sediminibacillus halophilus]SDM87209.1 Glutaredoxin [Sediminibacillus halophilus]
MTEQNVVVYVSDNCSQCHELTAQLDRWGIEYTEKNISRHKAYTQEMQSHDIYGTPAVFINDYKILGFQKQRLRDALMVKGGRSVFQEKQPFFKKQ